MNWFPFTYILNKLIINSIHAWLTKDYRSSGVSQVNTDTKSPETVYHECPTKPSKYQMCIQHTQDCGYSCTMQQQQQQQQQLCNNTFLVDSAVWCLIIFLHWGQWKASSCITNQLIILLLFIWHTLEVLTENTKVCCGVLIDITSM